MEDEQKTPGSCDEGPQRVRCRPTSNSGNVFLSFSTGASAAERKSCGPAHRNERAPHLERKKKKGNPQQNHIYIWAQTAQGNTPTAAAAPAC